MFAPPSLALVLGGGIQELEDGISLGVLEELLVLEKLLTLGDPECVTRGRSSVVSSSSAQPEGPLLRFSGAPAKRARTVRGTARGGPDPYLLPG